MKKNIFIKGTAALALALSLGSCASDYLDLEPITSIDSSTVTATVDGARYGLYGICRTMWMAEDNFGVGQRFVQGEAAVNTIYGDLFSADAFYYVWAGYGSGFFKWDYMRDNNTWIPQIAWVYYYNIIAQANRILDDIDEAEGDAKQRDFVKAQCLTMRAHAYERLSRIYAPRWQNSNNGNAYCLVIRDEFSTQNVPLSTLNQVMDRIYGDLNTAISLYESCGQNRSHTWEPNINIAYGVYARAAMTKNDWTTARDMAKKAREGFPIMSADEYKGGFAEANSEYMWCNALDSEMTFYWNWGTIYACNGAYVSFWGQEAGQINYDLYKQLHDGDIRKDLFFTPDKLNYSSPSVRPLTKASWWNSSNVDPVNMNINKNSKMKIQIELFGKSRIPGKDEDKWGTPYTPDGEFNAEEDFLIPFGAQYKFWGLGDYSVSSFPFMRGAEFLLYEAEAAYNLHDEPAAQQLLVELNSKRFSDTYTCTLSGEELMEEIRLTSRIELWGEGHSWYNFKRWNIPFERRVWKAGDVDSNNIPETFAAEFPADKWRGWCYTIPNSEIRYNKAIDQSLIKE